MKKALLVITIVLGLSAIVMAGVDFSGTWVLNAEKSDPMGRGGGGGGGARGGGAGAAELTIKQTGNVLVISRMGMGGTPMETSYTMDGADQSFSNQMGETKYKAVISGNTVNITGTQPGRGGEPAPMKISYTLSDDGKMLTMATTRVGGDGTETVRKQVYDKK